MKRRWHWRIPNLEIAAPGQISNACLVPTLLLAACLCFSQSLGQQEPLGVADRTAVLVEELRVNVASGQIEDSHQRLRLLEQLGEPGVTALGHVVQEGDAPFRARLVRALVGWGGATSRVFGLNQFVIAFDSMKDASVTMALHERLGKHHEGAASWKWLLMALGMAGDPSVADPLHALILTEEDLSTKAVALRAFARSAREDAVSLLLTFENDDTPGGRDSFGPLYPLQIVARDELARLRQPNQAIVR